MYNGVIQGVQRWWCRGGAGVIPFAAVGRNGERISHTATLNDHEQAGKGYHGVIERAARTRAEGMVPSWAPSCRTISNSFTHQKTRKGILFNSGLGAPIAYSPPLRPNPTPKGPKIAPVAQAPDYLWPSTSGRLEFIRLPVFSGPKCARSARRGALLP